MAESNLGEAVLTIRVESALALQEIGRVKAALASGFDNVGKDLFKGLEASASQSGKRIGDALRNGIEQSAKRVKKLDFLSFQQALDFKPANTIKGLEQYARALQLLRDKTDLNVEGTQKLTDRLGAVEAALSQARRTTAQTTAAQRDFNIALEQTQLKRLKAEASENTATYRAWEAAIRSITDAQRAAARASREAADAAAAQLRVYRDLAKVGLSAAGAAVGAAGKGAVGAARTGVKIGKAAYGIGAELGIFEEPKPGKVTAAIQTVIDRLKFLGEQATTTRGFLLRTFEAGGVAAVAQYRDQLKTVLDLITGTTGAANAATGAVGALREALNNNWLLGNGNTLIGKALNAVSPATDALSATTGALDSLTRTGANAFLDALSGVNQFSDAIVNLDPKVQAAVIALGGLSVAFREKPIVEGLSRVTEYLEGLRTQALQVRGDLESILSKELQNSGLSPAEREQKARNAEFLRQRRQAVIQAREIQQRLLNAPLALPNTELLQQRLESSGSPKPQQLRPGLNATNEQAVEALRRQVIEAQNLAKAEGQAQVEQTTLNAALEAGLNVLRTTVDVINEQAQGYKFQTEQLQDQLAIQQQLRTLEAQRSKDARSRLAAEQSTRDNVDNARQRRLQKQREDDFDRRLGAVLSRRQDQQEVRRRVGDATGSALIGGAFPLLFGQGLGASIGGGIGGAAGGLLGGQFGFGLSLIGTAIGQFADDLRQRAGDLAEALRSPAANFETLKQNFIFASRSQEEYVKALLESGQTAKATAVIQNEASRTFDPAQANLLSGSTDRLNRSWSDLSDRLGNFVAGPAAAFNDWLANIIKTVGGVPGQPQKVTGPSARQGAGNQSILGGATITAGLGLTAAALAAIPTGGLSLATLPAFAAALGLGTAGVATTGVGIGAVANAEDRRKIAVDPTTIAGEKALEAIKARQLELENQIVQAKLAGRTALVEQLNIEAKVTALNVQFAEAASKINQDRAAGKISAEEAVRLQNQLVEATRAQKIEIAAQAAASARTSAQQLKDAKALVGVYGTQRDILEEQQKVQAAQRTNDAAQAGLAAARARGATPEDLKIYENAARAAKNNLLTVRVQAEEKIRQLETQRWADSIAAANKIAQIQRQTAITALQRDVGSPGIQALQALEQLRVARDAEREAQARLRVRPGDQALRDAANQAAEQTKAAAEQTRQTLIDAYTQAKDAARQIGRSIEDAANQLLRLQSGGDGLNAFLFGDARRQEQQTAFNALLPQFQQDRQTAAALYRSRGNESAALAFERLNFSGTLEQVNAQMLQFRQALQNQIRSEQDYQRLLPDGVRAQNALTRAEASLRGAGLTPQDTIPQLLTSLNELAQKKWNVTVNVDSKGNVQSFGDLLPSTF